MSLNIVMIGSGYVGLVSGTCFADFGHSVTCVDIDEQKVTRLKRGEIPIFEPGLASLVHSNCEAGRLTFTTDLPAAVSKADVVFIAVGTPSRRGDGHADLSYVYDAALSIADSIRGFTVIVTKSTVPVGTGDEVERLVREARPDADIAVVSNPESCVKGRQSTTFGVRTESSWAPTLRAIRMMEEVYRPLSLNEAPLMFTDRRTAELIKYAGNAFLAMKITFINEVADLCEKVSADVQAVARGIGLDNRIGKKFLNAGPGYGGSCFPKDTLALVKTGQDYEAPLRLIETTVAVNEQRKRAMARRVISACGGNVRNSTIALLGLTFKPNTDDMRDAPPISIVQGLLDAGANVRAYDPEGMTQAKQVIQGIEYASDAYSAAEGAGCVVLVTEWNEFRSVDLDRMREVMKEPRLIDLRNVYRKPVVEAAGFQYSNIGRGSFGDAVDGVLPRSLELTESMGTSHAL